MNREISRIFSSLTIGAFLLLGACAPSSGNPQNQSEAEAPLEPLPPSRAWKNVETHSSLKISSDSVTLKNANRAETHSTIIFQNGNAINSKENLKESVRTRGAVCVFEGPSVLNESLKLISVNAQVGKVTTDLSVTRLYFSSLKNQSVVIDCISQGDLTIAATNRALGSSLTFAL